MVKKLFWSFEHPSIADGAKFEKKWTAREDYTIRKMLVQRKDGAAFTASDITVKVAGNPLTRDKVLCATFGTDWLNAWHIDEDLPRNEDLEYEGVNREGVTLDIVVTLWLEKKS